MDQLVKERTAPEHLPAVIQAYHDLWETIAHDLSAPGACMHRDEVFQVCNDSFHMVGILEKHLNWWLALTRDQRWDYRTSIFKLEFYEVGDNSGFGEDGRMDSF